MFVIKPGNDLVKALLFAACIVNCLLIFIFLFFLNTALTPGGTGESILKHIASVQFYIILLFYSFSLLIFMIFYIIIT